jgi:hypothetical protein
VIALKLKVFVACLMDAYFGEETLIIIYLKAGEYLL